MKSSKSVNLNVGIRNVGEKIQKTKPNASMSGASKKAARIKRSDSMISQEAKNLNYQYGARMGKSK